jgi:hypothetical protein
MKERQQRNFQSRRAQKDGQVPTIQRNDTGDRQGKPCWAMDEMEVRR